MSDKPPPDRECWIQTQYSVWHQRLEKIKYKKQRSIVLRAHTIVLPNSNFLLHYLQSDGLVLPAHTNTSCPILEQAAAREKNDNDDVDDSTTGDDTNHHDDNHFGLETLSQQINAHIAQLGGRVIPKLNWSAPQDSVWVNNHTMECRSSGDVYLLLKASDCCAGHDVNKCQEWQLHLQLTVIQWCNLHPSRQVRCFVFENSLVGLCQRQLTEFHDELQERRHLYVDILTDLFDTVLQPSIPLSNYVFDVYIDGQQRVYVLDINVWRVADAKLFTYDELENTAIVNNDVPMEFRTLNKDTKCLQTDPWSSYRAPLDAHVLDGSQFVAFMEQCRRDQEHGDSTTSENDDEDKEEDQ